MFRRMSLLRMKIGRYFALRSGLYIRLLAAKNRDNKLLDTRIEAINAARVIFNEFSGGKSERDEHDKDYARLLEIDNPEFDVLLTRASRFINECKWERARILISEWELRSDQLERLAIGIINDLAYYQGKGQRPVPGSIGIINSQACRMFEVHHIPTSALTIDWSKNSGKTSCAL